MRTNASIVNPYIRGLLAREIMGHRRAYWRNVHSGQTFIHDIHWSYIIRVQTSMAFASRFDAHLRKHQEEIIWGDPSPLKEYPTGFAGH
jgi:hypothetical protein